MILSGESSRGDRRHSMRLQELHSGVGVVTVIVFLGTGLYMRMNFPELYGPNEVIRYLYRANHIYLLFSGLLNIAAGFPSPPSLSGWKNNLFRIGSWLLLGAPVIFLWAFIAEPSTASPMRPLTFLGVGVCLSGIVFQFVSRQGKQT